MAPKGKAADKKAADKGAAAKGKGKPAADDKAGKVKGAQQINVRHILVSIQDIHLVEKRLTGNSVRNMARKKKLSPS